MIAVIRYLLHENSMPAALVAAIALLLSWTPAAACSAFSGQPLHYQSDTARLPPVLSQNDDDDENEVSGDDIQKYVSVYKAMQRNRSLTVDRAAAAQGLTLEQFRQLENRVQRDDAALQQARDELQAAAQGSSTPRGKR